MSGPDWLPGGREERGEHVYLLDEIRAKCEVRELPEGNWLVLSRHSTIPESGWLYFAVLRFFQSKIDGSQEMDQLVFYGDGPGGKPGESLRECRHTYWGEDGYIFYPDGRLITAAFRELAEFFDDMAAEP